MSSASALPAPPECVTQIASPSHSPRTDAVSPSSGKPSGVNDISPLNVRVSAARPTAGRSEAVSRAAVAKSSSVNGTIDGCISPPTGRMSSGSVSRGSWR